MTDPHELDRLRFQAAQDLIDRNRLRARTGELVRTLRQLVSSVDEDVSYQFSGLRDAMEEARELLDKHDREVQAAMAAKLADEYCSGLDAPPR